MCCPLWRFFLFCLLSKPVLLAWDDQWFTWLLWSVQLALQTFFFTHACTHATWTLSHSVTSTQPWVHTPVLLHGIVWIQKWCWESVSQNRSFMKHKFNNSWNIDFPPVLYYSVQTILVIQRCSICLGSFCFSLSPQILSTNSESFNTKCCNW